VEVVLINPEIPPNTGSIGRTCVATNTRLHLVRPLGFSLDEAQVKRAGLDYWENVDLHVWDDWSAFEAAHAKARLVLTSARRGVLWSSFDYQPDDFLCFGPETVGLGPEMVDKYGDNLVRIPIWGPVRSLNISVAVGIVLYTALERCGLLTVD
jgi:tRNA (cytidine/uridine-2'-O-)-methyltransferase